jgi:hypothetical protein
MTVGWTISRSGNTPHVNAMLWFLQLLSNSPAAFVAMYCKQG